MQVDPVSGNEIPPGSLPEEVRDDVDAKLSNGEYVVPADVLRYYGVGFFEKLRAKAKKALGEMDAEGRIGGVEDEEEDDFPFSDEELMTAEDEPAFAEGGVVDGEFNLDSYSYGGGVPGLPTSGGMETKTYIDKNGNRMSVLFMDGRPMTEIPAGYVPDTEEGKKTLEEDKPLSTEGVAKKDQSDKGEAFQKDSPAPEIKDPKTLSAQDLMSEAAQIGAQGKFTKGLMAAVGATGVGAPMAAAIGKGYNQTINEYSQAIQDQVKAGTMDATNAQKALDALKAGAEASFGFGDIMGKFNIPSAQELLGLAPKANFSVAPPTTAPAQNLTVSSKSPEGGYRGSAQQAADRDNTKDHYERAAKGDPTAIGPDYDPYSDPSTGLSDRSSSSGTSSSKPSSNSSKSGSMGKDDTDKGKAEGGLIGRKGSYSKPKKRSIKIVDK